MTSQTFFFIFIPILAIILLAINLIFAPHNPYQEKDSAFECGFHSFLGQNRSEFSISFFIFALLFLLFDLEILLVYPYIVSAYVNEGFGLTVMLIFFLVLTLGFAFELGKNALSIDSRQANFFKEIANKHNTASYGNNNMWDINLGEKIQSFFFGVKSIRFASPLLPVSVRENQQQNLEDKYKKFVDANVEVALNDGKIEGFVNRMKAIVLDNKGLYHRTTVSKVLNAERECEEKRKSIQENFDRDITAHNNDKVNYPPKLKDDIVDYEEQRLILIREDQDRLCLQEAGEKYHKIIQDTRFSNKNTGDINALKYDNKVQADSLIGDLENAINDSAKLNSKFIKTMNEHWAAQDVSNDIEKLSARSENFAGQTGGDQTGGDD